MDHKFLLEAILTHLDEGILVVDVNGNVTFYNEPATSIAGISRKEAVGKNILDIFSDLTEETSSFYHVLKTKEPLIDYIQTYTNYKGEEVSTVTSTIPLLRGNELIGAIEIYRMLDSVSELTEKINNLQKELSKKGCRVKYKGNGTQYTFDDIIGQTPVIRKLKSDARVIVDSSSPVLIYGETGTGKELLVQSIHNASAKRRGKPFIAQNCAAIPNSLLESILFGTSLGSFTGAKDKPGLFELANGGTLFLDEINSMHIDLQSKLLRILQDGIVRRVGGRNTSKVDVRVIASTNENPEVVLAEGKMRKDLYYRLNVISFNIPPLRERRMDIEILIDSFINDYNKSLSKGVQKMSVEALQHMKAYDWPGNIRELRYAIESMMNFSTGYVLTEKDIPSHILNYQPKNKVIDITTEEDLPPLKEALAEYERSLVIKALSQANGNCAKAARILHVPRQTLHNKIKKYDIKFVTDVIC